MSRLSPLWLMVIGFVLLLAGFIVPFMMVIQVMQPSFLGAFLSYFASVGGLIMGVIGSALYVRERRN